MKKVLPVILCITLCFVVAIILPRIGTTNLMVDDTGCLECHEVGTFGANDGTLHGEHTDCAACHEGGTGMAGNVASSSCLACHPENDSEKCDLVLFHEDSMDYDPSGASCLVCHGDCDEEPTTTTTADVSTTTTTPVSSTTTSVAGPCPSVDLYGEGSEEVEILRYLRDNVLSATPEGQEIIRLYYQWAPVITIAMSDEEVKAEIKALVDGILLLITE